jgi:hypothetical protein
MKRNHLIGLVLYDICDHSWFVPPTLGTKGYKVSLSLSDRISGLRWYDNQLDRYVTQQPNDNCTKQVPFAWGDWEKSHGRQTDT